MAGAWVLSVVWLLLIAAATTGHAKSLFGHRKDIIANLEPDDFVVSGLTGELKRKDLIIVNFHSPSCGTCIAHAPKWIEFAKRMQNSGMNVGAVDCDANRDLCSAFKVRGTPSIQIFQNGVVVQSDLDPAPERLYGLIEKGFGLSIISGKAAVPTKADEPQPPPPPLETEMPSKPKLRRTKKSTRSLPTAPVNEDDIDSTAVVSSSQSKPKQQLSTLPGPTFASVSSMTPKQKVLHDASLSLRYSLETGVFLGKFELSEAEQDALFAWLDLLRKAFPTQAGRWQIDWLYTRLKSLTADGKAKLTSRQYDGVLEGWSFARRYGEDYEWKSCGKYDSPENKRVAGIGYTCGLWYLFHIATISAAKSPNTLKAGDVSKALHGFVKNFFSCNECRENFLKHNPEPYQPSRNGDPYALTLWLWREHNFVSNRLNNEEALSGATRPKREMFPSEPACPTCYKPSAAQRGDVNGMFDEGVVVRYLDFAYSNFEETEELPFTPAAVDVNFGTFNGFVLLYRLLQHHGHVLSMFFLIFAISFVLNRIRRRQLLAKWKRSKH